MQRSSLATLSLRWIICAKAVAECREAGLPTFVEPLPVVSTEEGYKVVMEADAIIQVIG